MYRIYVYKQAYYYNLCKKMHKNPLWDALFTEYSDKINRK